MGSMVDDTAFALEEAEHALRQLATWALPERDWHAVAPALDVLTSALTAGDPRALQQATGRLAVLLAIREPARIRPAAAGTQPPPNDVLYRINALVDVIVVRRREASGTGRDDQDERRDPRDRRDRGGPEGLSDA
jgi:hypothetical protein